ncbi:DUF3060 domain-containing protein [Lacisediminihabitans sp. FW035]
MIRERSLRLGAMLGLLTVAALVLGGCTIEIVRAPSRSVASTDSGAGDTPPLPGNDPPTSHRQRVDYENSVSSTVTCSGAELEISSTGTVVSLTDDCAKLTVSATGAVMLAQSVGVLTVSGSANTVFVSGVTTVVLTGTGNTVYWREGTPEVRDSGIANTAVKGT